jgi:hypothetical protein
VRVRAALLLIASLGAGPETADALKVNADYRAANQGAQTPARAQIRVFLDCEDCFADFLRSEITFVDYVRDRAEADVHLLITRITTGSGGREYTAEFIGSGRFDGTTRTLKANTTTSDS